jgi:D-aminoacyl-tRNA deacylase
VRLLLQRVARAEVRLAPTAPPDVGPKGGPVASQPDAPGGPTVAEASRGAPVGRIGLGLLVFVGVGPDDGDAEVAWAADRLLALRVFADADGKSNLDLRSVGGELMLVSQFTLYADLRRGRRPGFSAAAAPLAAEQRYRALVERLRAAGVTVATGAFGRAMHVESVNDGPVTLWLDSAER